MSNIVQQVPDEHEADVIKSIPLEEVASPRNFNLYSVSPAAQYVLKSENPIKTSRVKFLKLSGEPNPNLVP